MLISFVLCTLKNERNDKDLEGRVGLGRGRLENSAALAQLAKRAAGGSFQRQRGNNGPEEPSRMMTGRTILGGTQAMEDYAALKRNEVWPHVQLGGWGLNTCKVKEARHRDGVPCARSRCLW